MATVIREERGIAVIEVVEKFHVVGLDRKRGQVESALASDSPRDSGRWYGRFSDAGIQYVSSGRSRAAAMSAFRRLMRDPD